LTVIVDYNKWQATGRSNEVLSLHPLVEKWKAFGWTTARSNGHNISALVTAMCAPATGNKPLAIIAHYSQRQGVSFMEDDNNWHYRTPKPEEITGRREKS
jgi:transketolase